MVDGPLHLRQNPFPPVMLFLLASCWKLLSELLLVCSKPLIIFKYPVHRWTWNSELTCRFPHAPARISLHSLHNRLHNCFCTNRSLSTRNRLAGGYSNLVYCFHTLNTALRHTLNCFVMSRLLIPAVLRLTIWRCFALDAILLEVMFINERNDRHVCVTQFKSAVWKRVHFREPINLWNYDYKKWVNLNETPCTVALLYTTPPPPHLPHPIFSTPKSLPHLLTPPFHPPTPRRHLAPGVVRQRGRDSREVALATVSHSQQVRDEGAQVHLRREGRQCRPGEWGATARLG